MNTGAGMHVVAGHVGLAGGGHRDMGVGGGALGEGSGWRKGAYNASPVGGLGQLATFKAAGASLTRTKGALHRGRKLLEHLRDKSNK